MMEVKDTIITVDGVKIDLNGHFGTPDSTLGDWLLKDIRMLKTMRSIAKDHPEISDLSGRMGMTQCYVCGDYLDLEKVGEDFYKIVEPCRVPGGYKEVKLKLNIPSGKLAIANDLRRLVDGCPDYYVNYDEDKVLTTQAYADLGMFHTFVGNSCPSIIKYSDTKLSIENLPYDEETDDTMEHEGYQGYVCTDLWWWSGMDYDFYLEQCKKHGYKEEDFDVTIVEVEPGCYEATDYYYLSSDDDWKSGTKYVEINRIGDVTDIPHQSLFMSTSEYMKSVEGYLTIKHMAWPSYSRNKEQILDNAFCSRGEWKDGRVSEVSKKCDLAYMKIRGGMELPIVPTDPDHCFDKGMWEVCRSMMPIFNVPDNIKPDWLEAVFWYLDRVIAQPKPAELPEEAPQYKKESRDRKVGEWENYQKIAPQIREELLKRFPR